MRNLSIFSSHLSSLPRALLILSRMISGYGLGVRGGGSASNEDK